MNLKFSTNHSNIPLNIPVTILIIIALFWQAATLQTSFFKACVSSRTICIFWTFTKTNFVINVTIWAIMTFVITILVNLAWFLAFIMEAFESTFTMFIGSASWLTFPIYAFFIIITVGMRLACQMAQWCFSEIKARSVKEKTLMALNIYSWQYWS